MPTRSLILAWQALALAGFVGLGVVTGLGVRVWLILLGVLCGAACHAWWQRHRGPGPLDLPEIRRTTTLSACAFGLVCGLGSLAFGDGPSDEWVIAAIGTALVTGFAAGVLSLCGLSLGLGDAQPTTEVLPDPTHPERGRRKIR